MDQQVNKDLNECISDEDVKIEHSISIQENLVDMHHLGGHAAIFSGPPDITLTLNVYFNQKSYQDMNLVERTEKSVSEIIQGVEGRFMSRHVYPFRSDSTCKIVYVVKLLDYEDFQVKLHNLALSKMDREFTEAFETKITEN